MTTLISFDPGLRDAGVGVWENGKLSKAFLIQNPVKKERGGKAWMGMAKELFIKTQHLNGIDTYREFISEIPQVYLQDKWKGDPADLIELAGVVGAAITVQMFWWDDVRTVLPKEWKGQISKEVCKKRIMTILSEEEKANIQWHSSSLDHNIVDAIGIGLYGLGRFR